MSVKFFFFKKNEEKEGGKIGMCEGFLTRNLKSPLKVLKIDS